MFILTACQAVYACGQHSTKEDRSQADLAERLSWYFTKRGSYPAIACLKKPCDREKEADKLNEANSLMSVKNVEEILHAQFSTSDNDTY